MALSRRQFLTGLAGVAGGATLGGILLEGTRRSGHAAAPDAAATTLPSISATTGATAVTATTAGILTSGQGTLVLVTLYGGNDGLNTVVPVGDPAYAPLRGQLAVDASKALALSDGLALAPEMVAFKRLWDAGQLAVVRGVSYPNPNRSHFRSMDIWQSADPVGSTATGWIGRWLDAASSSPLDAVATSSTLPLALTGARTAGAAIPSGGGRLGLTGATLDAWRAMQAVSQGAPPLYTRAQQSGLDLLTVSSRVGPVLDGSGGAADQSGAGTSLEPGAADPTTNAKGRRASSLADQLDTVSRLIRGGVPTRVYFTSMGGFDTHANEAPSHPQLMADLDQAVGDFLDGLAGQPGAGSVVVAVYSEFGRRPAPDASGGTDHGVAAPVLIAGSAVRGGFIGDQPSLTSLDPNGDLVWNVDYRSIYATLLDHVLGADPASALLGASVTKLDLIRT